MKRIFLHAALVSGLMLGTALVAAPSAMAAAKGPSPTPSVGKALAESQKAFNAGDFPTALAAIQKAKAVSDPSPYDKLLIARFLAQTEYKMNDMNAADAAAEEAADTDPTVIPDTDKSGVYAYAMQLAAITKHYDKAIKYYKMLQALGPVDPHLSGMMLSTYYNSGDYTTAAAMAKKNIADATAAGKQPSLNDYSILVTSQVKLKDEAGAEDTLEQMAGIYNDQDAWSQIISVSFSIKGASDMDPIYLGRLMFLVDTKITANDASLVGQQASHEGLFGDVAQSQKYGGTGFTDPTANIAKDKANMAKDIAGSPKENGDFNAKLGEELYGYGMYAEAEAAARRAIAKGGIKVPGEQPDMLLAMSLAGQGKYPEALAAFQAVKGGSPATPRIVRLWTYYVKSKMAPAAAAPAPAPTSAPAPAK